MTKYERFLVASSSGNHPTLTTWKYHTKSFCYSEPKSKTEHEESPKNTLSCWTTAKHLSSTPLYKRFVFPAVVRIRVSFLTYATFRMTTVSFRTETYGRVWGISSFYFPCNSSDCTLALSEILRYFEPQNGNNVISNVGERSYTIRSLWGRFFLPAVVRMTGIGKGFFTSLTLCSEWRF